MHANFSFRLIVMLFLLVLFSVKLGAQSTIDISGQWQFQLDPDKKGHKEEWFEQAYFDDNVQLPGTTDTNRKGNKTLSWPDDSITRKFEFPKDFDNPKWIYELNTAPSRRYKYIGAAWYQKNIEIPASWDGKRMELFLERSLFKVEVWIDGNKVGEDVALYTPRRFELTPFIKAGQTHRLTLCIDNTNLIGGAAHGYTYHTQTNWNGVVGQMEIRRHNPAYIKTTRIYTDIYDKNVRVEARIDNNIKKVVEADFELTIEDKSGNVLAQQNYKRILNKGDKKQEFYLAVDELVTLWDEFTPELYTARLKMKGEHSEPTDEHQERFGFREISTSGTSILINNHPVFMRGVLDCAIYPKTGYMPMDRASWEKVLGTIKNYGMNHLRYHSVCPPKVAFDVADELGIYLQAELIWGPEPTPQTYALEYLYNDGFRILDEYGNHPSFALMALSNEISYTNIIHKNRVVDALRNYDPRRLYSTQVGHVDKKHTASDIRYNKTWENGASCNIPREKLILSNDFDFSEGKGKNEPPLIIHENGQWVMYPGFDFMRKYDGVKQADNFLPMYERLKKNGLESQDKEMAIASGKHGVWHMKQTLESLYRTKDVAGFEYLGLQDFPGQSEAMVGILDPFWDSKGYISPKDFRKFCNDVVPLARFKKWVYTTDETFEAKASVWNYSAGDLADKKISWKIASETGEAIQKGTFPTTNIKHGGSTEIGNVNTELSKFTHPGQYMLEISIEGTDYKNDWDFYVYPPKLAHREQVEDVYITQQLDDNAYKILNDGGKVFLKWRKEDFGRNVLKTSFTPHYWSFNRGALGRNYPGTAGMLCNLKHPMFNHFPTQSYADSRWMHLIHFANAFILNDYQQIEPIVQIIDDYHRNNKMAAIFEVQVGNGKLLACALDLESDLENRPEVPQIEESILSYMSSSSFQPKQELSPKELTEFLPDPNTIMRVVEGSSRWPLHDYRDMLDGNPNTFWSSEWNGEWRASASHHVVIDLGATKEVSGCLYTPRQDSENGRIGKYEIYVSQDGKEWGRAVAKGEFKNSNGVQKVYFDGKYNVNYIKVCSVSEVNNRKWAAIADLSFF
ncbi:MAG: discoidin domain-containing protein [Bacteroidales bacterium]